MYTTKAQICIRRDTAANFTSANPTLALGEIAYETDTRNLKVGDGATAWTALPYINPYRAGTAAAPTSNTVMGSGAGVALQSGAINNTLIGQGAGAAITTGDDVVAIGFDAAKLNTANETVAIGSGALDANTTGTNNTAVGRNALGANTTASDNTAVGRNALAANLTGANNEAFGSSALTNNTTGLWNTAIGSNSLNSNQTAAANVAIGRAAMEAHTAGDSSVCVGAEASRSIASLTNSIIIGRGANPAATGQSNQIVIGYLGLGNGSNTTTIGNSSTTGTFIPAGNLTLSSHTIGNANGLIIKSGTADIRIQAADGAFGDPTIGTYSNSPIIFKTNSTARGVFTTAGNFQIQNGNLVMVTAGTGIDFSATSEGSGTMTSELLNDYEEGTWTPAYITTGVGFTTMTMSVLSATYTKVGRQVTVRSYIATDNVDTAGATGNIRVSGLPFTSNGSSSNGFSAGSVGYALLWGANGTPTAMYVETGSTVINMMKRAAANGDMANMVPADFTTGANAGRNNLIFTATYFV
jgi:hypothetical protein